MCPSTSLVQYILSVLYLNDIFTLIYIVLLHSMIINENILTRVSCLLRNKKKKKFDFVLKLLKQKEKEDYITRIECIVKERKI